MPQRIEVHPDQLARASARLLQCADEIHAGHASTDARIADAQSGWVGRSADALTARVASWQQTSAVLHERLNSHGTALRASNQMFAAREGRNSEAVAQIGGLGAAPVD